MTLYLDTSAWVKLYVQEPGSAEVDRLVKGAELVATCRVAYPEARAALARRTREGCLSTDDLRRCVSRLDHDFTRMAVVTMTPGVIAAAGELAETRRLRGVDAMHLSAALELQRALGEPVAFACFDERLRDGARDVGLDVAL